MILSDRRKEADRNKMNKEQFLNTLEECLSGQIDAADLRDTLRYYREYIEEEEQHGKTEQEVLQSLGSPRLIAHSILDAHEEAVHGSPEGYYDSEESDFHEEGEVTLSDRIRYYGIRAAILAVILALLVISFMVLKILFPFILLAIVAGWIYRHFFRD